MLTYETILAMLVMWKAKDAVLTFATYLLVALILLPPATPVLADEEEVAVEAARLAEQLGHFLETGRCVNCDLAKAVIGAKNLSGARLTNATMTNADLAGADFSNGELAKVKLSGANLVGVNFTGANMKGADLSDSDLTDAVLRGADLTGADLTGAQLDGADFWGAEIRRADLSNIKVDKSKGINKDEVGSSGKISIFDR